MDSEEIARLQVQRLQRELHKQTGNAGQGPDGGAPQVVDRALAKAVEYLMREGLKNRD